MPEDVDLVASGARLGNHLDRDVVVAEELHLDAGKQLAENGRNPAHLARMGAPDDDLAFRFGGGIERGDLRRIGPSRLGVVRCDRNAGRGAEREGAVQGASHVVSPPDG
jgi:hypothetical protein